MSSKLHILLFLLAFETRSYGQESQNTKVYEIRNSIAVYPCFINGKNIYGDNRFSNPPLGAKFMLVGPLGTHTDTVIIRYLKWYKKQDSALRRYYNEPLLIDKWDNSAIGSEIRLIKNDTDARGSGWSSPATGNSIDASTRKTSWGTEDYGNKIEKFFKIRRYDLDSNCVKVYNSGTRSIAFTVGLVTMPLKLRPGNNFDFQGSLSLGSTAGIKLRLSKYSSNYINLLLGTSISTVSLDSFNTKGKLTGQPLNNMAVFSPSLGLVFEFGKAQAGIFFGWDILNKSNQTRYEWIYNKKSWISIGFGFSIFNIDGGSNKASSENQ